MMLSNHHNERYLRLRWPQVDWESWPGREAKWAWQHPILLAVLGSGAVGSIVKAVIG